MDPGSETIRSFCTAYRRKNVSPLHFPTNRLVGTLNQPGIPTCVCKVLNIRLLHRNLDADTPAA